MKPVILTLLVLSAAPLVQAQENPAPKDAPRAAAQPQVHLVTIVVREKGNNIPAKFSGSIDLQRGHLIMPLFLETLPEWIAEIIADPTVAGKDGQFILTITNMSRLTVLRVELPLEIGPEILVHKSPTFSLAIQFEEGS